VTPHHISVFEGGISRVAVQENRDEHSSYFGFRVSLLIPQRPYVINPDQIAMNNRDLLRRNEL